MTQAGGPAAINGFLYQIVHHLGWLSSVSLRGELDEGRFEGRLILEPRNGGDARAEGDNIFLVEQYKTRPGTWSIAAIISVLADLRKAVPTSPSTKARYRFVTDGRPGRITEFSQFLREVKAVGRPADLDNMEKRDFGEDHSFTNREYFHRIARTKEEDASDAECDTMFHLLSCFEMEFEADGSEKIAAIDRLLRPYVPNLGDEISVRQHLVGILVEKLSKGEVWLDARSIDDLLRTAKINPDRLRRLVRLPETTAINTKTRLELHGYSSDFDVRTGPDWPNQKPVLIIAGHSGFGKTWQLGRTLHDLACHGEIVSLVRTGQSAREILQDAARDIWIRCLGETSDRSLPAVLLFLKEACDHLSATSTRITIARDDIKNVDVARDLVREDWAGSGARLILTVPTHVAQALEQTDASVLHVHYTGQFSVGELSDLFARRGRQWVDLPPDLKKLLRHPLLAGLFFELPYGSIKNSPQSEYEIFDRLWQRVSVGGRPGDEGILLALAKVMYEENVYPLPRAQWDTIGLDAESADRLDGAAWLRVAEGDAEFSHDRLFNWAVAKSLVADFSRGRMNLDGLTAVLVHGVRPRSQRHQRTLGYVPMDALWLLAGDPQNARMLSDIVLQMESASEFNVEDLYSSHLPSLGQRAVPVLRELVGTLSDTDEHSYRVKLLGQAFTNLTRHENVELGDDLRALLASPLRYRQTVAIAALTGAPNVNLLDRLWELHKERTRDLDRPRDGSQVTDYRASFEALRAAVELNPEWLRQRIRSADAELEPVSELAYLLRGLDHIEAEVIWSEVADLLIAKVRSDKARSVLTCIARFGDHSRLSFVVDHLTNEADLANSAALFALSIIDPRRAIEQLGAVRDFDRYASRNNWLPGLLRQQRKFAQEAILTLAQKDARGHRIVEDLYWERPDAMDEPTLAFFLRALEARLRDTLAEAVSGDPGWLSHALDFLGRITSPDLLAAIAGEAGDELERMITAVACGRLRVNSNWRDHLRENARRFLILISGSGITELISRELESEHYWIRHSGILCAFMRNDPRILQGLSTIARRPIPRREGGKPESDRYMEYHQAMTAMAALGDDETLLEVITLQNISETPNGLADLRAHRGPMEKRLTNQALLSLRDVATAEDGLITALTIAWLSDDPDFIEAVRSVLARSEPNSKVAGHAAIALMALGDTSDEFANLARVLAVTTENQVWGRNALAGLGERGLQMLADALDEKDSGSHPHYDDFAIRTLYADASTRPRAVDAAVRLYNKWSLPGLTPYDIVAEASAPEIRERIIDKAFAGKSMFTNEPLRPILGLAKFDVPRAIEAIDLALVTHPTIENDLCRLLVTLIPDEAASRLLGAATAIGRESLFAAVGRALRRVNQSVASRVLVEQLSGTRVERKAAAAVAGWLSVPEVREALVRLIERETDGDVRSEALASLERQDRNENLQRLLAEFPDASYDRKWAALVPIVENGDPRLLRDRSDTLWLGAVLGVSVPYAFEHYANFVLRNRKEKI